MTDPSIVNGLRATWHNKKWCSWIIPAINPIKLSESKHRRGEKPMLEVTEKATEKVKEFFKSRDTVSPLRIFVAGIG
jgi:hypothetical protein